MTNLSENDIFSKKPQHIAFIMDGNGRWAKQHLMARSAGHIKGADTARRVVKLCMEREITDISLYAFSTENWNRPKEEISSLMTLFLEYLKKELNVFLDEGIRLKVVGDISPFPTLLQDIIQESVEKTAVNDRATITIAANYGGRWDIVEAVKSWFTANPDKTVKDLTEQSLCNHLTTAGLPDIDLVIRTGGNYRLSNFMLWQSAYSEIYVTDTLWPDFDGIQLDEAIAWFSSQNRNFGTVRA